MNPLTPDYVIDVLTVRYAAASPEAREAASAAVTQHTFAEGLAAADGSVCTPCTGSDEPRLTATSDATGFFSPPPAPPPPPASPPEGVSTGLLVGLIAGGIVLVAVIVISVVLGVTLGGKGTQVAAAELAKAPLKPKQAFRAGRQKKLEQKRAKNPEENVQFLQPIGVPVATHVRARWRV